MTKKTLEEAAEMVEQGINIYMNVMDSLSHIQLKLKAPKDKENSFAHFNYRTAGAILERVKPLLAEVGCVLTVTDEIEMVGERYYVKAHAELTQIKTGEVIGVYGWAREGLVEKGKADAQMTGSASTYAKKYALCNLFAIDDSEDDPDVNSGKVLTASDRELACINALNCATSKYEVDSIKQYYADVMTAAKVIEAGKAAKDRMGY